MELAAGNLYCNKTVHKSELSFRGTISTGNKFLCLCASLRQGGFPFIFFPMVLSFKWLYRSIEYAETFLNP